MAARQVEDEGQGQAAEARAPASTWACLSCTFDNASAATICAMCDRPQHQAGRSSANQVQTAAVERQVKLLRQQLEEERL